MNAKTIIMLIINFTGNPSHCIHNRTMRNAMCFCDNFHRWLELAIFKILKSRGEVVRFIRDKGNQGGFLLDAF